MAGPVESRWACDHPVHRRQRLPSMHAPAQIRQRGFLNFKPAVSELGRVDLCLSDIEPNCLVPNKGSMGPKPAIAP
jgi:hypothetical protein